MARVAPSSTIPPLARFSSSRKTFSLGMALAHGHALKEMAPKSTFSSKTLANLNLKTEATYVAGGKSTSGEGMVPCRGVPASQLPGHERRHVTGLRGHASGLEPARAQQPEGMTAPAQRGKAPGAAELLAGQELLDRGLSEIGRLIYISHLKPGLRGEKLCRSGFGLFSRVRDLIMRLKLSSLVVRNPWKPEDPWSEVTSRIELGHFGFYAHVRCVDPC